MTMEYNIIMEVENIQPEKIYNLKEIHDLCLIPWALHYQTLRKIVSDDQIKENVLQAVRQGEGRLVRYTIEGKNIIKYIKRYGPVQMIKVRRHRPWKQKQQKS
jgi:hypothetical protein